MNEVFLKIFNLSITSGYIVLVLILLRPLLKKIPKKFCCALWAVVGLRLVFPFSFESIVSLVPSNEPVTSTNVLQFFGVNYSGAVRETVTNNIAANNVQNAVSSNPGIKEILHFIIPILWVAGIVVMLAYAAFSYLKIRRNVSTAVQFKENIKQCETVQSPFILGIIKPTIYLPFHLNEDELKAVCAHEYAHIRRFDHLIKPLAFALLSVYWFNPLLWVAYFLLCKDIELACDEKVLKGMEQNEIKTYAKTLLNFSYEKRSISVCPLAFGESSVKERIQSALNYKKPAFWVIFVSVVLCIAVSICFLTNRPERDLSPSSVQITSPDSAETDCDGVSIELVELAATGNDKHITVKFINDSEYKLIYGESFRVTEAESGKSAYTKGEEQSVYAVAHFIPKGESREMTYALDGHELNELKEYIFETSFDLDDGENPPQSHSAKIRFHLQDASELIKFTATNGKDTVFRYYEAFEGSQIIAETSFCRFALHVEQVDNSGVIMNAVDLNNQKKDQENFLLTSNTAWNSVQDDYEVRLELVKNTISGVYEFEEVAAQNLLLSMLYDGEGETYIINNTLDVTKCFHTTPGYPFEEKETRTSSNLGALSRSDHFDKVFAMFSETLEWSGKNTLKQIQRNTREIWQNSTGAYFLFQSDGSVYYVYAPQQDEDDAAFVLYVYKLKKTDSDNDLHVSVSMQTFESESVIDKITGAKSVITFYNNGAFTLSGALSSNSIATGGFFRDENKLYLEVNEEERYVFEILNDDTISFIEKESKNYGIFKFLKDGFKYAA